MKLLYTIGIYGIGGYMRIAALFNEKAAHWVQGRKGFFKSNKPVVHPNVYWFHCASLGEFDMAIPVMNLLKADDPSIFMLVTFFSPSGMNFYHKRNHPADQAIYLPLDTPKNARKFLTHFNPKFAFFIKYEFWSNVIFEANRKGIKTFSICTSLRENQVFFKWYGSFFRKTLRQLDWFYVQNDQTKVLLGQIELTNTLVTGDTRFDRVIEHKKGLKPNVRIEAFLKGEKAIVIGSSWLNDEELWFNYLKNNTSQKVIIAPHEIDNRHIDFLLGHLNGYAQLFTKENETDKHILILDTIGHLSGAYAYGSFAYVGGGFSGKLHNILEPAVYGLPVLFGPKFQRFPEAMQFIEQGFGFSVDSQDSLEKSIRYIEENMADLSHKSSEFVRQNQGSSEHIIGHLASRFTN